MHSKQIPQECNEMKLRLNLFQGTVLCPAFWILSQKQDMAVLFTVSLTITMREMAKELTNRKKNY